MKWIKHFDRLRKGWIIKACDKVNTPVVFLPEPLGGRKDASGLNSYNKKNAQLIEAAPELLRALKDCSEALKAIKILNTTHWVQLADKAIKKAED
jgi:hypothetical protein